MPTVPVPVPLFRTVIQLGAATLGHAQPLGAVTPKLNVPPALLAMPYVGETVNVQESVASLILATNASNAGFTLFLKPVPAAVRGKSAEFVPPAIKASPEVAWNA